MSRFGVLVLVLVACTPPRTPPPPVVEHRDDPLAEAAGRPPLFAKLPPAPDASFEDAANGAFDPAPDEPTAKSEPTSEPTPEPQLPSGVTMEDGIAVIATTEPMWCVSTGKLTNPCRVGQDAYSICRKMGACVEVKAVACFVARSRMSGADMQYCFASYGFCEKQGDAATRTGDYTDREACVIVRRK